VTEFHLDPETLHEVYADPDAVRGRVQQLRAEVRDALDQIDELRARGDLVEYLRGLGELDEALTEARRAVDRAEIAGNGAQQHTARLRLAHVRQWRGEFAESNMIFTELLAVADRFGAVIEAYTHQHAGQNDYDQRHWADARAHFERALELREHLELDEASASRLALAAAVRHLEQTEQTEQTGQAEETGGDR
jgi:tetratricopeptide (TPR) repeat protein